MYQHNKDFGATNKMDGWNYGPSVSQERRDQLLARRTFESIAEQVAETMRFLCWHRDDFSAFQDFIDSIPEQKRDANLILFWRPIYCVEVHRPIFDLFFNSPYGYRGAYYNSPSRGLGANAAFIRALKPKLLSETASEHSDFAADSLSTPSAKAWLAESGKSLSDCSKCRGEYGHTQDGIPEILNGRWERAGSAHAKDGRKAPYLTKIKILGAFLNGRGDEFVPHGKIHRAQDIYDVGWS